MEYPFNNQNIKYTILLEPYFIERLKTIIGRSVLIETVRGNLQGILAEVNPDHVIVNSYDGGTVFYVRIQQIVNVMPV